MEEKKEGEKERWGEHEIEGKKEGEKLDQRGDAIIDYSVSHVLSEFGWM